MSAARVSRVSQELYEGIRINGEHVGLITYIRTDSTYLSETYVNRARAYIKDRFGEEYVKWLIISCLDKHPGCPAL